MCLMEKRKLVHAFRRKTSRNTSTHNKENSIHNIVRVLKFQQLLANKEEKLG